MSKKVKALASAAGARTDEDFALFSGLVRLRDGFSKLKLSPGAPPVDGIILRYDHYLTRGRFYEPQSLPKGYRRGKPKQCYNNSYKIAVDRGGLTYCEGYVLMPLGERVTEVEHGWCVTAEGGVIDVTLKEVGLSYFGVPYSFAEMAAIKELPIVDSIITEQLIGRVKPTDPV